MKKVPAQGVGVRGLAVSMPEQNTGHVVKRYAVKVVRAIRVVLLASLIAWGLIAVATMAGWDVVRLAEDVVRLAE